jgi:hypothetical protein
VKSLADGGGDLVATDAETPKSELIKGVLKKVTSLFTALTYIALHINTKPSVSIECHHTDNSNSNSNSTFSTTTTTKEWLHI